MGPRLMGLVVTFTVAPVEGAPPQDVVPDGSLDLGNTGRLGISAWRPQSEPTC